MNLVLYKHHIFIIALCCDSRIKPIRDKFQRERERLHLYQALLGNWCQRGRERSHQSLSFRERSHLIGGRDPSGRERDLQGERILVESISQGSQMLGVQEERCHMSYWGERHVHMCLFALVCTSSVHSDSFSSDFLFPIFSQYPMLDSGGARHLRERNHSNSLHIFTLGDMSNPM